MIKVLAIFAALFSSVFNFSSAFAQEVPEKISGRGVLPAIETSQEYQVALEQAVKNAVLNACASIKSQQWVSAKKTRIEQKLLSRAWDFVAEYRVVGKGKDSEGSWIVVEARIFWDKLKDALALSELPELPSIVVTMDKPLKEASWSDDFLKGLKYGLVEKGFLIAETLGGVPALDMTLWLGGKNKIRVEVRSSTAGGSFIKEFELADDAEFIPYDTGLALAGVLVEKMVDEKVVIGIYEFALSLSGIVTYSDVIAFTKQLYIAGAVRVAASEAEGGKIVFKIVALKPKEEILSRLVGLGFKVSAE